MRPRRHRRRRGCRRVRCRSGSSSSMKAAIQSGRAGWKPSCLSKATACTAATTPSAPSRRPPEGTVFRWDPTSTDLPDPASPVAEAGSGRIDLGRETKSPKPRGNPIIGSEEIRRPREPRDAAPPSALPISASSSRLAATELGSPVTAVSALWPSTQAILRRAATPAPPRGRAALRPRWPGCPPGGGIRRTASG